MSKIFNLIKDKKKISIIGMEKNVGKTTVLNSLIAATYGKRTLGLTSIGRDGEERDLVTATPKPRIYVYSGTVIATAKDCLNRCDITKEILCVTDYSTPMGNIIIVRALSDGYVDIAGPSYNSQLIEIAEKLENFGCSMVIIDGALSRKGSAASHVCEGTILATGAALSPDMHKVVEETENIVTSLQLPLLEDMGYRSKILKGFEENRFVFVSGENMTVSNETGYIDNLDNIKKYIVDKRGVIAIKGAITNNTVEVFLKNKGFFEKLSIVGVDGTKFFLDPSTHKKAKFAGIDFKVLNRIEVMFVTINPTSPTGNNFDKIEFKKRLSNCISCDVIDVKEEKCDLLTKLA